VLLYLRLWIFICRDSVLYISIISFYNIIYSFVYWCRIDMIRSIVIVLYLYIVSSYTDNFDLCSSIELMFFFRTFDSIYTVISGCCFSITFSDNPSTIDSSRNNLFYGSLGSVGRKGLIICEFSSGIRM